MSKQIVIIPGGFHPYHAGHHSLYNSALKAFPGADVYVAATNDTKTRPFPFSIKEKLAKLAGVASGQFVQVKSPFKAEEITSHYNPAEDVLIFVRSEKDRTEQPKPGGKKKDGTPAYFQPWTGKNLQPFSKHAYIAYLPTVEFGPGITSATEIRKAWPTLDDRRKTAMVMSLYPATQKNPKLAANVVKMLDMSMGGQVDEGWKDIVAGGAMALGALGAGAQTMPNINAQQVELANKYYNVLVQRAKEDGIKLDTRTLNVIKAKAQDAAAKKTQQSTHQQGFSGQGSERKVAKDAGQFESDGVAEGLSEARNSLFAFVKQQFPTWPDYVLKDFLYQQAKGIRDQAELDDFLKRNKQDFGNCKWTLTKLPITFDIFTPKTQRMLASREGGSSNPFQVPRDAERHAQQSQMIQQKGVSAEPIIVAKLSNGYDLIEGWHRTIQHLKAFPQGYTGPAWVCTGATYKSESVEQGVAEGSDFFAGSKFADEEGNTFSVEKIIAFAKNNPKYFRKDFPLSKIKHDLSWWQGNKERMMNADTSFPLLVIQNDDGHLGVADGLNRMKKAVDVEKKQTIDVYLVPKKDIMKFSEKQGVEEARTNPDQNTKPESGMKELASIAKTINDPENWAISMTSEPKLGINPQVGISEDTPKGIYFYPLNYVLDKTRYGKLPWGNDYPYIQLFKYDRSGEMTKDTQVDPARLKQAVGQYCSEEIMQQAIEENEYDGTPYWFIYDCLSRLGKGDETNVVRWNKVLRDLGFTSVFDNGAGWIAYNEPTQGVVLDPRVIKQHKTITNKQKSKLVTPAVIERAIFETMDMELASNRAWQAYDPDGSKLRAAAKEYAKKPEFKQWFGKPATEEIFNKAASWGRYGARELSQESWEWFKAQQAQQKVDEDKDADPVTSAVLSFYKPVVNDIHKEKLPDYVDQARGLLQKTNDPEVRSKLVDIFKKGKENPYIQGGIVTTVGAVLAGGILNTAQQMGLSPAQTNLALQAILNTVIPTVVSRINGKNWRDTIKYTLASAGVGTGIAGASLIENDPWGDQGNFAGDKPFNIGGSFIKRKLSVGDMVKVNAGHFKGIGEIVEIKDDQAKVWIDSYARSFVVDLSDLVKYIPESKDYLEEK